MKKIFKIVFLIIGTIVGAGFASGKEIYLFFNMYGKHGILGIILSSMIAIVVINKVLKIVKENKLHTYFEFLNLINNKYKKVNFFINFIVNAFLLISYFIMIAGFSAYMKQSFGINTYISSGIFCIICIFILLYSIKGIIKTNELLIPILILFICFLGIKNIPYIQETKQICVIAKNVNVWWIKAVVYISYNSIILIPILTSLDLEKISKKDIQKISIICGLLILILSLSVFGLLLRGGGYIKILELPLTEVLVEFGATFKYIYGFIIIISIFTSAISSKYSFLQNISKDKKTYLRNLIIISIIGIFVANIGFSNLVQILYPIFGVLGLFQILLIIK